MRFFRILSSVLAVATAATAATQSSVERLMDLSASTNELAKSLPSDNASQAVPQLLEELKKIVESVAFDVSLCPAHKAFIRVQDQLAEILVAENGLLGQTPLAKPLVDIFNTMQEYEDTFLFAAVSRDNCK